MPRSLKISYALFLCVLIPVYIRDYPLTNFLWFSDIALILTGLALWTENSLLASMMAVAVLLPETIWNISFFAMLIFRIDLWGMTGYMFDPARPFYLRALSLFHVALPVILVYLLVRLGYDRRAWFAQTIFSLLLLPLTYALTDPIHNINWVFGPGPRPQHRFSPLIYLGLEMIALPILNYLPMHLLFSKFFRKPAR